MAKKNKAKKSLVKKSAGRTGSVKNNTKKAAKKNTVAAKKTTKLKKVKNTALINKASDKKKKLPSPNSAALSKSKSSKNPAEKKPAVITEIKSIAESGVPIKRTRKSSKKPLITLPPPPKIEVSNYPKNKVKNILISQPKPVDSDKNPYVNLGKKYHLNVNFRHFIRMEGLSSQDFRAQKIDILEHGAVILTSKLSVDHYFKMCNEMRVTVPETMKYFCINEQTAYYLQKYIQYRKRKIFFGHGTILDLVDVIRKNKDEKFLLPVSDVHKEQIVEFLDELQINYTKGVFYKTVSADLSDMKSLSEYDMLVFFTPAGIKSLKANFPNFKQGGTRIAAFGHTAALAVKELGLRLDIFAPNPKNPSMSGAIETYIRESNKR